MDQWKLHIQNGNAHFFRQEFTQAEHEYRLAIQRSRKIFSAWFNRQQAIAALVVSYHNQADVYIAQRLIAKAESMLRDCYEFLCLVAEKSPADDALLSGLRRSYSQLLLHIKQYGSSEDYVPPPFDYRLSSTSHPEIEVNQNVTR